MARPLLVIGNRNYSSWSLRPWLLALPAMREWRGQAEAEIEVVAAVQALRAS